jgi:hypothetical protein
MIAIVLTPTITCVAGIPNPVRPTDARVVLSRSIGGVIILNAMVLNAAIRTGIIVATQSKLAKT